MVVITITLRMYYMKNIFSGGDIVYKSQDQEDYKTTTIRMKSKDYEALKVLAVTDHCSTNYLINRILIDYIIKNYDESDFKIFD